MTTTKVYQSKSRPSNNRQYETSEQIGKPLAYFFFSASAAGFGVTLLTINANRVYQCQEFFWSEVGLSLGAAFVVAGVVGILMTGYLLFNREYGEIVEEIEYEPQAAQPGRVATIHTSTSDSIISLNQLGEKISGIFFPNRVLALVKNIGRWPTRDFWLQDATWQGTGQDKWTTDIYNKNTSKLCGVGVLEKRGNRYQLTEKGERFFKISPPTP